MSKNEPAFPNAVPEEFFHVQSGMTLRDWFATHAPPPPTTWWGGSAPGCSGYALWNYQYADAMLAERTRT